MKASGTVRRPRRGKSFGSTRWWGAACQPQNATHHHCTVCESLHPTMWWPSPASGTLCHS
uniref:Ribosomal protein L18A n=1 Tax=Mus musculus TaxID=10090 RepID=A0A1D5RLA0_MOUSE